MSSRPTSLRLMALTGAVALATALTPLTAPATAAKAKAKGKTAKVTVTKLTAKGAKVTVAGRVTLPRNTAKARKQARVSFVLASAAGRKESFTAPVTAKLVYSVTKTTRLTGSLGLTAQVKLAGRTSGKKVVRTVTVAAAAPKPSGPTGPAPTPTDPGANPTPTDPTVPGPTAQPLVGTFRIEPGKQAASGAVSGSYFRMKQPVGDQYLTNGDSSFSDQTYTPLTPGTDGGLRTGAYQVAPDPPFSPGNASLADRIIVPTKFFGPYFGVVTEPDDRQGAGLGTPFSDPAPAIVNTAGTLSGQVTAWTVGWNGVWFNQGSPKPDGTSPGRTQPVTGTYAPATGRYSLDWASLIVGGPFNGFTGHWHLEGAFAPAR